MVDGPAPAVCVCRVPVRRRRTVRTVCRARQTIGASGSRGRRPTPFDVDAYARDHFARHGAQTRTLLSDWVRLGECFDRPARTTAALLAELRVADERRAAAV